MLVRIANREDPDQTASFQKQFDLGLHCLSRLLWQETRVRNFRTFTVPIYRQSGVKTLNSDIYQNNFLSTPEYQTHGAHSVKFS